MKILLIASNPSTGGSLELEREITELQQRLLNQDRLGTISLKVLPSIDAPSLIGVIADYKPDVVHIIAHGNEEKILFSNDAGFAREITNDLFVSLLASIAHKPKLIFVSACSSGNLARALLKVAPFTIGTTGTILSDTARKAAAVFYEWLARGYALQNAVDAARSIVCIEEAGIDLIFEMDKTHDPSTLTLVEPLRILACFPKVEGLKKRPERAANLALKPDSDGDYQIEFGLAGCPPDTRQIVFFVDDDDFVDYGEVQVDDFAWIDRGEPRRGERWVEDESEHLMIPGDCRIHAALVTRSGSSHISSSSICEALELYYFGERWHRLEQTGLEETVRRAIAALRCQDGSRRSDQLSLPQKKANRKRSYFKGRRKARR